MAPDPRFRTDPEFERLMPALTDHEIEVLSESLFAEGCRDAVVVWKEEGVLLDGHNRAALCDRAGISYDVVEVSLADREAARTWIIRNQLARRNLPQRQFAYYIGQLYNRAKGPAHRPEKLRHDDGVPAGGTAERLAEEHGVSPRTVERAGTFAENLDKIREDFDEDEFGQLLDAEVGVTQAEAAELAERKPKTMADVEALRDERAASRQPSSDADGPPYFQREIKRTVPYTDPDDGVEYVDYVELSCGHEKKYQRKVRADRKRKTAPCYECGSGTRTPSERRRAAKAFAEVMEDAFSSEEGRSALGELVRTAYLLTTLRLGDGRAHRLREEMARLCGVLGLEPKHLKR